ncbi:MAG: peptidase [Theionarchaea archaeon]|nr:peptidase [Theionarchaea archaeon]
MIFEETRTYMKKKGLPPGDLYDLPTSDLRFPDGAQYRIEVPTINTAPAMRKLLETAEKYDTVIHRVDETYGIMRHTDEELEEFIQIAKDFQVELNLSTGPRATYDTGATVLSSQGVRIGYRLRGMEQIVRAVEDVKRAVEMGCRGILIYDEGFLWLVNEMRKDGGLPSYMKFKLSAHCGHGNPASFKVLQDLGADSINPVRDLQLPMIAALRAVMTVPLDLHTDNPPASGGFIRTYEAPEMVRIGAPLHLKTGNSALSAHGIPTTEADAVRMAQQTVCISRAVEKYYPEAKRSHKGAADLAIPK